MGLAVASIFQTVLANVPPRDAGSGSGALQALQQIGSAIGIALTGQIFFSSLEWQLAGGIGRHASFVHGMEQALFYEMGAFALVALLVFFLRAPSGEAGQGTRRPALSEA